jgi:hypothetical protein
MEVENLPLLDEWQGIVDPFRAGKKGAKASKQGAAVLSSLLNSRVVEITRLLPDFVYLPSGMVGKAFSNSYSNLLKDKCDAIWAWIGEQKQDRQEAERLYALPGAMRNDAEAAILCLQYVRATTKEQKERLVSILSDLDAKMIASLLEPVTEEFKVRKAIQLLLTAAEEQRADGRIREAILEGILPTVGKWRLHTGTSNLRAKIIGVFERLPAGSASRIGKMLPPEMQTAPSASAIREARPESKDPPIQEATQVTVPDEASHGEPVASDGLGARQPHALIETPVRDEPTRLEHSKTSAPAVDQFAWLDAVIQVAALPQSYYLDIRQQLERGEQGREELQRKYVDLQTELAAAQAKIQQLQSAVDQVSSSNDAIQRERRSLSEALEREQQAKVLIESSMRVLQTREQGWGREREELSHRINDHAERTLADFKVALSFAISPVVRELPDIESPRLAELAPNLRVIIRQILDALADKGVEIKGAAGAAR